MPQTNLSGWECCRCGHKWFPRDNELPMTCPKCRSPYWNRPRKSKEKK